jgi:hypothetical protein
VSEKYEFVAAEYAASQADVANAPTVETMPGRRRGSHPPSPTDPDVSLSAYPARVVRLSGRVSQRPVREQVG